MNISSFKKKIRQNKGLYVLLKIPYFPISFYKKMKNRKETMEIIDEAYSELEKIDIKQHNIFYFGIPRHLNLGDMAQTYCTKKWIKQNYNEANIYCFNTVPLLSKRFLINLSQKVKASDIIFIQSGYCSHELHPDHKMHKNVVKTFQNNKIVILPQTVNIQSGKELKSTSEIYNKHNHLLFLARDEISYKMVVNSFSNTNVLAYPDIVTILIGKTNVSEKRNGILLCFRNDFEKLYDDKQVDLLEAKFVPIVGRVERKDTTITGYSYHEFYNGFDNILKETLEFFSCFNVVITDRYHGTIFSVVANTPVIVVSSNDHKVKSGVDWFKKAGFNSVFYAENFEEAFSIACHIIKKNVEYRNNSYFDENFYAKLKSIINKL